MAPRELAHVLRQLPQPHHSELLVGAATGDDAAVWKLDDDRALVSTADFITPIVDDARIWGRIAAANAVSDVYAMGGTPLFALNLVGWNTDDLPIELLGDVLLGGSEIAQEAGFAVVGGHTVADPEPKYGMAVTGVVAPQRVLTNAGLRVGQQLILTKPLGVGIVTTAIKADRSPAEATSAALAAMQQLNARAAQVAVASGATGCTDVTGFGLLGHAGRMAVESGVRLQIDFDELPLLPHTRELAVDGMAPGGTRRNLAGNAHLLDAAGRDEIDQLIVADAQTSGGLLFAVDPAASDDALSDLRSDGHGAARIGKVTAGEPIIVLR